MVVIFNSLSPSSMLTLAVAGLNMAAASLDDRVKLMNSVFSTTLSSKM